MPTEGNGAVVFEFPAGRRKAGLGSVPEGGGSISTFGALPEHVERVRPNLGPETSGRAVPDSYSVGKSTMPKPTGMGYKMPDPVKASGNVSNLTVAPMHVGHQSALDEARSGAPPLVKVATPPPLLLTEAAPKTVLHREEVTTSGWPSFMNEMGDNTGFVTNFRGGRWLTFLETTSLGTPRALRYMLISSAIAALDLARHYSTSSREELTKVISLLMEVRGQRY